MKWFAALQCAVLLVAVGRAAAACECTDYVLFQVTGYPETIESEEAPGASVGISGQFTRFGTLRDGGKKVADEAGQFLDSSIMQVVAERRFGPRFGLQLNVPYIYRSFRRPAGMEVDEGTVSGLGDVALIGSLRIVDRFKGVAGSALTWTVLGGIKLPTGNSDRLKEEEADMAMTGGPASGIHGHSLALGSGSYDGIAGTSASARGRRFFTTAAAQYAVRTRGSFGYRYANGLSWSVRQGAVLWRAAESSISLALNVSGDAKGKDTFRGEKMANSGTVLVYIGPEVSFKWRKTVAADLGADFPVVENNTGFQAVPDYRLRGMLSWRF